MTRSTTSFISAAITSPPISTEPPGPRPFKPGPRSPAWPLRHSPQGAQPRLRVSPPLQLHNLTMPCVRRDGQRDLNLNALAELHPDLSTSLHRIYSAVRRPHCQFL